MIYQELDPISLSTYIFEKYSHISYEFRVSYCARRKTNSQFFRHVKHSTISGVKDIRQVSNILPDNENIDSKEIVDT